MSLRGVDRLLSQTMSSQETFYREFAPPIDLAGYVACTWMRIVRCAGGEICDSILPDGCADIMLYDGEPLRVAGPDAVTRRAIVWNGLVILGIRLRPGACRAVLGCPAADIVNGSILLDQVTPTAGALHRAMLSHGSYSQRLAALEHWVRNVLHRAADEDRTVIAACRLLAPARTPESMKSRGALIGTHAQCIGSSLLPAGTVRSISSASCASNGRCDAGRKGHQRLAELAVAAGFSDQAHMTRDFQAITGFTPRVYLAARLSPGWGAWIEEDW